MEKKKKVAIIQRNILHYRIPLWNKLNDVYDITIIHCGKEACKKQAKFKQKIYTVKDKEFFYYPFLLRELKKYSVVVAPIDFHFLNLAFLLKIRSKVLLFGHFYGKNKNVFIIKNVLHKLFSGTIVYTKAIQEKMINNGLDPNRIFIARNTMEILNSDFNKASKRNQFLYVGRLYKEKRIDLMINVFSELWHIQKIPESTKLCIVGDGDIKKELKELAKKLYVENNVVFEKAIYDSTELKEVFDKSLAYLCTNHGGLGFVHSLAYGVPIIVQEGRQNHGPEFDYLVHEENALIFNNQNEFKKMILDRVKSSQIDDTRLNESSYAFFCKNLTVSPFVEGFSLAIKSIL